MTPEQEITLWNTVVPLIEQQIEEVGPEAAKKEYWLEYLAKEPQAAQIYSSIAEELAMLKAVADTYLALECKSIGFANPDGTGIVINLVTFEKSVMDADQPQEDLVI